MGAFLNQDHWASQLPGQKWSWGLYFENVRKVLVNYCRWESLPWRGGSGCGAASLGGGEWSQAQGKGKPCSCPTPNPPARLLPSPQRWSWWWCTPSWSEFTVGFEALYGAQGWGSCSNANFLIWSLVWTSIITIALVCQCKSVLELIFKPESLQ